MYIHFFKGGINGLAWQRQRQEHLFLPLAPKEAYLSRYWSNRWISKGNKHTELFKFLLYMARISQNVVTYPTDMQARSK